MIIVGCFQVSRPDQGPTDGKRGERWRERRRETGESLLCGCLEALILPHTHTHTLHSNVNSNFMTRREKGQQQQACKDAFLLPFFPSDISASNTWKLLNLSSAFTGSHREETPAGDGNEEEDNSDACVLTVPSPSGV